MKLSLLLSLLVSFNLFGHELTEDQKISDLNQLISEIKIGYGPLEYKKELLGLDLSKLSIKYLKLVKETKNNSEFYYTMAQFVAEFDDAHFSARIPTNHKGRLHFNTDYIGGKILITQINRDKLSGEEFPFKVGDEVIEFDGRPVMEVHKELNSYRGMGNKFTNNKSAAYSITSRQGSQMPVQDGKVKIKIRRGKSDIIDEVELEWELTGTPLDEFVNTTKSLSRYIARPMNYDDFSIDLTTDINYMCSGKTRVKIPDDATMIMEKPFVAYYHKTEKGNIGYLRIPHYSPKDNFGNAAYEVRGSQYEYAISELEKNTVGLVIDQDHNCGGSVAYLHSLLTLLNSKPVKPMQFELLATKQSYLNFRRWVNFNSENTIARLNRQKVIDLVYSAWMKGDSFLTEKTSIGGEEFIYPNYIHYTKPILVLADEMSGSGGDAFPSIMQGIGRAKLLGTRTMGAGGHVIRIPALGNSQMMITITKSLFYRPDGVAVENNGAVPDIKYRMTRDDIMNEYRPYQKFYIKNILEMIK